MCVTPGAMCAHVNSPRSNRNCSIGKDVLRARAPGPTPERLISCGIAQAAAAGIPCAPREPRHHYDIVRDLMVLLLVSQKDAQGCDSLIRATLLSAVSVH
jgi:hypothetical protein